jgi:uncharacterized protein YbaR (Trm112 family)
VLISLLPFLLYRLTTQRWQGFLATLSLPLWSIALQPLAQALLAASIFQTYFRTESAPVSTQGIAAILNSDAISFLIYWLAAVINWMWKREFQAPKIRVGASVFAVGCVLVLGWVLLLGLIPPSAPHLLSTGHLYVWVCLAAGCVLTAWSFLPPDAHQKTWAGKTKTVALLRSPYTAEALHIVNEHGREFLTSPSGERFPIRNGIPLFYEAAKQ